MMIDPKLKELEKALPLLPGYKSEFKDRPNERKSHAFDFVNGNAVYKKEAPGIGGTPIHGQPNTKTSLDVYPHQNATLPSWIAFDRQVLRFYAYFQESVQESQQEKYRVRKVNIYFYLEDDSIHVSEPKLMNSGIPQGTLVRRHRIPKGKDHFIVTDLNVGQQVTFYSKTFQIVGCDPFTREFLSKLSIHVPDNQAFPVDPYESLRADIISRMKPTRPRVADLSLKQKLENDRKVLRFYCVWDDTNSVFGDVRNMVVHYYLSDDTIEVRESIPANSGRDHNSSFLRRSKVPKDGDEYYKDSDFLIGSIIYFYGRPFLICDCDEFTKAYYKEHYGIERFDPVRIEDEPAPQPVEQVEEKHHFEVVLRFLASLESDKPVDKDRQFVISLHMKDQSISVFEPRARNSGVLGGKFLEQRVIPKPQGGNFTSKDFNLGATVVFYAHRFTITGADEFAKNFIAQHPNLFKQ